MNIESSNITNAFISYSNKDINYVNHIALELVNLGINVWYDKWRLDGGDYLWESISDAINKSEIFIVILSKNSLKSTWVRKETQFAFTNLLNKAPNQVFKIVPIRVDNCKISSKYKDVHILDYSPKPEIFISQIAPIFNPELQLNPNPLVQYHSREQFFNKAIAVLGLEPKTLRTSLVGPIFLYSKTMVSAKQIVDQEKRASFSDAMRKYLYSQRNNFDKNISIVIKLITRYENILKNIRSRIDIKDEISRMKKDLVLLIPDDDSLGMKVAVSKEYQYSFFVTDKILIEAERFSVSEKMESGWSTTQPIAINQKIEMFDSAFNHIYKNNIHSKNEIINFLDDFASKYI